MPKFVFFDRNKKNIEEYKNILSNTPSKLSKLSFNFIFIHGTLDDILDRYYEDFPLVLVSPANSYCNMKGGIDYSIIKKFPKCEKRVLEKLSQSKYKDSTGRKILPVGKSFCVELDDKQNALLVSPTMETPRNIVGTNNIYLSFSVIWKTVENLGPNTIIACPCLGTGIGEMTARDSAIQILNFLMDIEKFNNYIND